MRRIVGLLLVVAVIATACASEEDAADTTAATTSRAPVTTVATTTRAPVTTVAATTTTSTTRAPTTTAVDEAACGATTEPINVYGKPPETGDGWETASLQEVGMDPEPLADLLELIADTDNHLIHSLLIVKDQKLVFEEYWPGADLDPMSLQPVEKCFDRDTPHWIASVSKSLTSAVFGIALDEGLVASVEDPLFAYFPDYSHLQHEDNEGILLRHLLSYTSGYEWIEFVYELPSDPRESHSQMFNTSDPIEYLLGRPMVSEPGSEFLYNSGDTNLVGEIVRRVTASPTLADFANENLFEPLGIEAYEWLGFPRHPDITWASGGVLLRPRDVAKIGALYVNSGVWDGERILSSEWVEASTEQVTPVVLDYEWFYGYGYNWWLARYRFRDRPIEAFAAGGWGGQTIFAFPEIELIVVRTAGAFFEDSSLPFTDDLIEDYILAAVVD